MASQGLLRLSTCLRKLASVPGQLWPRRQPATWRTHRQYLHGPQPSRHRRWASHQHRNSGYFGIASIFSPGKLQPIHCSCYRVYLLVLNRTFFEYLPKPPFGHRLVRPINMRFKAVTAAAALLGCIWGTEARNITKPALFPYHPVPTLQRGGCAVSYSETGPSSSHWGKVHRLGA